MKHFKTAKENPDQLARSTIGLIFVWATLCLGALLLSAGGASAQEASPQERFEAVAGEVGDIRNSYRLTRTIEEYNGGDVITVATIRSEVLEGRLTSAELVGGGRSDEGTTVEDLFAEIAQAEADGLEYDVAYDRYYGYPTSLTIEGGDVLRRTTTIESLEWGVVDPYLVFDLENQSRGWSNQGPIDYSFVFATGCGECIPQPPLRIAVENDEVVSVETLDGEPADVADRYRVTIDDLIERLGVAINDPSTRVGVEWAEFVPVRATFDLADPGIADGDSSWTISEFRPADGSGRADIQEKLDQARDLLAVRSYSLTYRVSCFCPRIEPVTVSVDNGEVVNIDGEPFGEARTWESIFAEIQDAIDSNVDGLTVNFALSPEGFTYITDYFIDPSIGIADEEYGVIIDNFEIGYVDPAEVAEAQAAIALWDAQGPASYTFDIFVACFCPPPLGPISVTVVDDVVVSVEPSQSAVGDGFTVEQLLQRVLNAAESSRTTSTATFDPTYGYPLSFSSNPVDPRLADGGYSFRVTNFTPTDRVGCFAGPVQAERGVFTGRMTAVRDSAAVEGGALGVTTGPDLYTFDESNAATYCVRVTPGVYRLDASVIAPDAQSDSVWVSIDDNEPLIWDFRKGAEWHSDFARSRTTEGPLLTILEGGPTNVTFYLRETNSLIDEFELVRVDSIGPFDPAICGEGLTVQGEAASPSGAMGVFTDASAEGGEYLSVPSGIDREYRIGDRNFAEFCIDVPTRGTYTIEATTIARDFRSDSFYVQVDDSEPFVWHVPRSDEWSSSFIRRAGSGGPERLFLSSGEHRIRLYHREPTALDSLRLVPEDLDACPAGWQRAAMVDTNILDARVTMDFPGSYTVTSSIGRDTEVFSARSGDDRNVFDFEFGPGSPFVPASYDEIPPPIELYSDVVEVPGCGPGRVGGVLLYTYVPGQDFRPGVGTLFVQVGGEYKQVLNTTFANVDEVQQILSTAIVN